MFVNFHSSCRVVGKPIWAARARAAPRKAENWAESRLHPPWPNESSKTCTRCRSESGGNDACAFRVACLALCQSVNHGLPFEAAVSSNQS